MFTPPDIPDDFSKLFWRSQFDRDGKRLPEPVVRRLIDLDADHLAAILRNCPHVSDVYRRAIRTLLEMP